MRIVDWTTHLKDPGSLLGTVIGWLLVCVGVLGIVLPVIPGLPLLVAGLVVLSTRYTWASFCLNWLKRRVKQASGGRWGGKETPRPFVSTNRG
jgi:hypothetical protein